MRSRRMAAVAALTLAAAALLAPASTWADSPAATTADSSSLASSSAAEVSEAGLSAAQPHSQGHQPRVLGQYKNVVVIYQENHSFDNLYGGWGKVGRQRVDGLPAADPAHTTQIAQDHKPYLCLPQDDVNLASPPLPSSCSDPAHGITSAFANQPFTIDDYINPADKTCPPEGVSAANGILKDSPGALTGGCTRDLVHRFYQEKYQIDGGLQDRYVTGSDAIGLTMGTYDTTQLPIYQYLHQKGAPHYVIADRFFQGANGGSFLNHQWLIAGRAPFVDRNGAIPAKTTLPDNSVLDANGMPTSADPKTKYPQYLPTRTDTVDGGMTVKCADPNDLENYAAACGNFAVNTVQPSSAPHGASGRFIPLIDDKAYPNIGDRLSAKGISWAWYSGGWNNAAGGHPGPLFQYHHQPFNYYADYAPQKAGRHHLQDENSFLDAAAIGNLPTVSFVKPYGAENEHPGYASANSGSRHLVDLVKAVLSGPQAKDTLVIITYDEFGGQWDHVSPPGKDSPTKGAYDAFGPGTRIPALLLSARMTRSGVDHHTYDTTSIITTLEHSFHLAPVGIRDTMVADLRHALVVGGHRR
jgi:acid phosphatase